MITVAIIGILAAIAIPGYLRFIKHSRTSEAVLQIRKIYDGEVAYFYIENVDEEGSILPAQFISAGPNPTSPPPGQKVSANWVDPSWGALRFALDSPVMFSYSAVSAGQRVTSSFTARANGDLDGDGTTSLFERTGSVDPTTGDVIGGAGIYRSNEYE
jgi:type IV pilus assembly protein PilA